MILYLTTTIIIIAIFSSTETVPDDHSDLRMNIDDCATNKTMKGCTPHEGFTTLSTSEKKLALLTTPMTDLSEDTSVYDASFTACKRKRGP